MAEHPIDNRKVAGSIPAAPTTLERHFFYDSGPLAANPLLILEKVMDCVTRMQPYQGAEIFWRRPFEVVHTQEFGGERKARVWCRFSVITWPRPISDEVMMTGFGAAPTADKTLKPLTLYAPVLRAVEEMAKLLPADRVIAFSEMNNIFCIHCGHDALPCYCTRDE